MVCNKMTFFIAMMAATIATSEAFWWGGSEREAEPTPTVKQVPVGYFRTYTYQPLPFNPAVASPYFGYGTAKMVNPLQYWPQKPYTQLPASSLSSYNGPLQAQGSSTQQTREPSPLLTNSAHTQSSSSTSSTSSASISSTSSSSASGSIVPAPPSLSQTASSATYSQATSGSSNPPTPAPVASIAESLTSDDHLPASPAPNTPSQPQSYSPATPPTQYTPSQFSPSQYSPNQYSAPSPSSPAQQYYPAMPSAGRPIVNPYLPTNEMNPMNMPYVMATGSPMPMQSVQFVPCMCPVSYGMATPDIVVNKRSEDATFSAEILPSVAVQTTLDAQILSTMDESL